MVSLQTSNVPKQVVTIIGTEKVDVEEYILMVTKQTKVSIQVVTILGTEKLVVETYIFKFLIFV